MNIEQYTQIMTSMITTYVFLTIGLLIGIAVIFCMLHEAIKDKDRDGKIAHTGVIILGLVVLAFCLVHIVKLSMDKNNESYITYWGDYEVLSQSGHRSSAVQIDLIEEGRTITLEEGTSNTICVGTYYGYIVYSKRSKVLVDWYYDGYDSD